MTRPNTLQDYARQVLFGTNLSDKLSGSFESLEVQAASDAFSAPEYPGRPVGLEFTNLSKRSSHTFPSRSALDQDKARGLVLHFFANHELLALELMALAILKFPDAPSGFLKGIGQTMLEEQSHMRLYIERMQELGVEFGDSALNSFFWRSLKEIASPQEYAAAMSLTFEQANLDFSLKFEHEFRALGDSKTAEILAKVRLEEIGHVKHGAIWLERWRDPARTLWEEYVSHLKFPITPMRAKGPLFDRDGRRAAGLPDSFIEQIESYSASKGRPPRVFWFNPGCEDEIRDGSKGFQPSRALLELTQDLSWSMLYLAYQDDVFLGAAKPSTSWILELRRAGFEVPEILTPESHSQLKKTVRKLASLEPWGWSPASTSKLAPLSSQIVESYPKPPLFASPAQVKNHPFSKALAASLRSLDDLQATLCGSVDAVLLELQLMKDAGLKKAVVKSPYGSSGRQKLVFSLDRALDDRESAWIQNQLSEFPILLVEAWVNRLADLSIQIQVSPQGDTKILGVTRFLVNDHGQYRGHLFGKLLDGLPTEAMTAWHNSWLPRFEESAKRVGLTLRSMGYYGPVGIDGFIFSSENGLQFQSLSEINPRYTMGRVALELAKHCVSKMPGVWCHFGKQDLNEAGFQSFEAFSENLRQLHPLRIREFSPTNKQLESGSLSTSDPTLSKQILPVLFLAESYTDLENLFGRLGLKTFRDTLAKSLLL